MLNWFNRYGGWVAIAGMLAFLGLLFFGCTTPNTPEIKPLPPKLIEDSHRASQVLGYEVHMGTHHLINAETLEEAQEFVSEQSPHHPQPLTIVTRQIVFSRPHYGRND